MQKKCGLLLWMGMIFSCGAVAGEDKPNVLVLLANDLRADVIGRSDAHGPLTPALDALSKLGVVFTNAYCPGTTTKERGVCRRAALFSGRSPLHVKAAQPGDLITMPSYFKAQSYSTSFVGESHGNDRPFESQFERNTGIMPEDVADYSSMDEKIADDVLTQLKNKVASRSWFMFVGFSSLRSAADVSQKGKMEGAARAELIPKNFADRAPKAYVTADGREKGGLAVAEAAVRWTCYAARVREMDQQIGRIIDQLRSTGDLEKTIIVFTSNNGIGLGSHGLVENDNLYEETIRVPLIISGQGNHMGLNDSLISLTDVLPTLIDMTGGDSDTALDGHSLKLLLTGERRRVRSTMFLSHRDSMRALRDERWKLIVHMPAGGLELYDLQSDPLEMHDLSGSPDHAKHMNEMFVFMQQWQRSMGDFASLPHVAFTGNSVQVGGQ